MMAAAIALVLQVFGPQYPDLGAYDICILVETNHTATPTTPETEVLAMEACDYVLNGPDDAE